MCDLINVNNEDSLIEMLMESTISFSLNVFNKEMVNEATAIRLPLDADRDLMNMGHRERDEIIDRVKRIIDNIKDTYISEVSYENIINELEEIRRNANRDSKSRTNGNLYLNTRKSIGK